MKKVSFRLSATIAMVFVLSLMLALSGRADAKSLEFKLAHVGSMQHQYQLASAYFKNLVEQRSKGEIKVNIFPQAQLGSEREEIEGVRMGTIEMAVVAAGGALPGWVPELQVLGIPYLFQNRKQAYAVLDGPIGEELSGLIQKKGFYNLGFWEVGFRNFTNNTRPIKTPADMKGLKIRVQESKIWLEFIKSLGAIPTPIPFGELYSALQQGVVDGQENPVATIKSMKFYEVQKYLTLDGHTYEPAAVLVNPKWFDSLSQDQQKIIRQATLDTTRYIRNLLTQQEKEEVAFLKQAGVKVEENPDLAAFAKATQNLYKIVSDTVPEALVKRIRAEVAKVK